MSTPAENRRSPAYQAPKMHIEHAILKWRKYTAGVSYIKDGILTLDSYCRNELTFLGAKEPDDDHMFRILELIND